MPVPSDVASAGVSPSIVTGAGAACAAVGTAATAVNSDTTSHRCMASSSLGGASGATIAVAPRARSVDVAADVTL